jgi:DNA excision repair protein ERCC-2
VADQNGFMRFFPYETPFDHQQEAMGRIYNALTREQHVLFEGACGTGKTLAALVPALEYARETDRTVVISTDVHQQMRQFVTEARAITRTEPIRAVVFRGKGSMCHIDVEYEECQVLRDTTYELVDRERERDELEARKAELRDRQDEGDESATEAHGAIADELADVETELEALAEGNTCEHYYRNLTADTTDFFQWLFDDVRTPDEIYEHAHELGFCGYELLKEGMENVDLVVCNYHHLLDPTIREVFFNWLDAEPDDVITVFDEAHNVEGAAREHATRTCSERTLDSALEELDATPDPRTDEASNVIEAFREALVDTYEDSLGFGGREAIDEDWEDVTVANEEGRDDLTLSFLRTYTGSGIDGDLETALSLGTELDAEYEEAFREGDATTRQECPTLQAASFVDTWLSDGAELGQHPVISVSRNAATGDVYGRAELYTCIPQDVTASLFDDVHASVLMSATLRPFDVFETVLGLDSPVTLAYGLTFPESNRRTFTVDTPPLFASDRDDPDVLSAVTGTLEDAIRFTPGNTLVFFPSYSEAARYEERLDVDATLYLDEAGTSAETLRETFVDDGNGALLTSLWATLTEGVSFDGEEARTVVVVGVPYPYLDDRLEAVQDAYDAAFADRAGVDDPGWHYGVEIPTIRKTRQAIGRVIRSPTDAGVRVLLDRRYTAAGEADLGRYSVRDAFPSEEREEMIDVDPGKLQFAMLNFYQDHDAYGGEPPSP